MAYITQKKLFAQQPYQFTHTLSASRLESVDLPNGSTVDKLVEVFKRKAALYHSSEKSTVTVSGFSSDSDLQFIIRKIPDDPFSKFDFDNSMAITLDGNEDVNYHIKNISRADNALGAYHLITITSKQGLE